eukprot:148786-Amphidinium_carterae.1
MVATHRHLSTQQPPYHNKNNLVCISKTEELDSTKSLLGLATFLASYALSVSEKEDEKGHATTILPQTKDPPQKCALKTGNVHDVHDGHGYLAENVFCSGEVFMMFMMFMFLGE